MCIIPPGFRNDSLRFRCPIRQRFVIRRTSRFLGRRDIVLEY